MTNNPDNQSTVQPNQSAVQPEQPTAQADQSTVKPEWPVEISKGGVTVRIFRCALKNGYVFFQVAYYRDGKRQREVLKSEQEARARARSVMKSLAGGEVDATEMKSQDAAAYRRAKELLAPTGVSLETACREYAMAFELLRGRSLLDAVREDAERRAQVVAEKTVREVVEELIAAKELGRATRLGGKGAKLSDRYCYQLELRLKRFYGVVSGPIAEVDSDNINEFILGLKKKSGKVLGGRTRNNYAESIGVLFEFARKQRYIPRDSTVLDELEEWGEDDFDVEIFTPDEMRRMLAAAPASLVPVLVLGGFAGLRTAEIARLDWSEVNVEAGHIEIKARKAKTRARRLVPMSGNLAEWVKKCKAAIGDVAGKDAAALTGPVWALSLPYLHELQAAVAEKAGLKWKHNGLRHSFISYRVAEIKNVQQVALEAGNSPDIIFQHYRELVTGAAAKEWFAVTPAAVEAAKRRKSEVGSRKSEATPANVVALPVGAAA